MRDVAVGIVNYNGRLLMIKRAKKEGDLLWAFPGGKIEDGESKEEACIREVYEESGLNVSIVELLGERVHPDTGAKISYFLCKQESGQIVIHDENEIVEVAYKTREEFDRDVKTDVYEPVKKYIKKHIK